LVAGRKGGVGWRYEPVLDLPAMSDRTHRAEPFSTPIRVRYADTDAAGVVYYANYLTYFEVARVQLLRELGCPITEVQSRGVFFPVVEATCRYRRPILLDDLVVVDLWLAHVERVRFSFAYEVRRDGELLATGTTRHAVVDRLTGRSIQYPDWLPPLFDQIPRQERKADEH
jgi:acyl-CoA thioester hydrolase